MLLSKKQKRLNRIMYLQSTRLTGTLGLHNYGCGNIKLNFQGHKSSGRIQKIEELPPLYEWPVRGSKYSIFYM